MKLRRSSIFAATAAVFALVAAPVAAQSSGLDLGRTIAALSNANAAEGEDDNTLLLVGGTLLLAVGTAVLINDGKKKPSSP